MSISTFGPYSPARSVGNILFVSGQVGVQPGTREAAEDVKSQTVQVLANMTQVLGAEGATLDDVVKTTIFLKDVADFAEVNKVYDSHFSTPYPARSCVEVARLPRVAGDVEILVEIEAVADCSKRGTS